MIANQSNKNRLSFDDRTVQSFDTFFNRHFIPSIRDYFIGITVTLYRCYSTTLPVLQHHFISITVTLYS